MVPAWAVWRGRRTESSGHPAPPPLSGAWLGKASTSGNRNLSLKRVIFIRQQLCLQNTFPMFASALRRWVGRIINPDLQVEKCSSNLEFGSQILGAGVKRTKESLPRRLSLEEEGRRGGHASPLPHPTSGSRERPLPKLGAEFLGCG